MKKILLFSLFFYATLSFAAPTAEEIAAEEQWNNTTLSDALIKKIQESSYQYKKCASDEMQKPDYSKIDVRKATELVIKQCEPILGKMREVYLAEKVPAVIADRQLKSMRFKTTRNLLAELMFRDAARKASQDATQKAGQ